jgi:hypothetical protein
MSTCHPRVVHVNFLVGKVAPVQIFPWVFRFSIVFIPALLRIHSFTIGILHSHNSGVDKWTRRKYLYRIHYVQSGRITVSCLTIIKLQNFSQIYVFLQLSVTQKKLLVKVSYTKGDVLYQGYRISLKIIRGIWSLNLTIQFQSSKIYPPLIYTQAGKMQVQQITLRGFRLLYKEGDIRISGWNVSTVSRSHGSEYHDG